MRPPRIAPPRPREFKFVVDIPYDSPDDYIQENVPDQVRQQE